MVIYEVNLEIDHEIYPDYMNWLTHHMQQMLQLKGFIRAKIANLSDSKENTKQVTIWYELNTKEDLEQYLTIYAPTMREDGIKRFGNKFSANRRIFESIETVTI